MSSSPGDETKGDETRSGQGPMAAVASLLLLVGVLAIVANLLAERRVAAIVAHDNVVLVASERLMSALRDIETGQRGFLLTGDNTYLEPYYAGERQIGPDLDAMAGVGLGDLAALIAARRASADAGIAVRRTQGLSAAVGAISNGRGKQIMDEIRARITTIQQRTNTDIAKRVRGQSQRGSILVGAGSLCLLVAFGLVALIALRRRSQARASAALLGGVLANAPVGLGLLGEDLRIRRMNDALSAMSDRALGADIGRSVWEVMPHLREALEPRLRQVLDGGRPLSNIEVQAVGRNERLREFLVSFYPLRRPGNESNATGAGATGAGMVVTDVTVRKRAERRMRESEERFRTLTEAGSAIVWTTTPEGEIAQSEGWTAFTGQDESALQAEGWRQAVHRDDREAVLAAWQASLASREPFSAEMRLRRADGEWRHMAARAVPIVTEDGVVREWIGTHTDITERKQAEAALQAARDAAETANRAKSQFLANMSHELRTPLSAVIGYTEMLEEEAEEIGHPQLLGDLGKINSNARHLLSLINDVLDLSKIEANRMTTYAERFDVATVVREAGATVEALVKRNGNVLDIELEDELGVMESDVVKLRQCLFNLLSNASKFTENGRISLRVRREVADDRSVIVFEVADSGIGMTAEQLGRLFERFSQADESTTRQFGGTGLGLAITRAFCRLLGGDVTVTSEVGAGTVFIIRLPAVMPSQSAGEGDMEGARKIGDKRVLVLVIDDDAAQRDLLARFLEREGFAVRGAVDGESGLELAGALVPDVILLDVMMPQMDGWSVLSRIKADSRLANIPVVMCTFVNEPGLGASLGAADYILKPIAWERLRAVMDRFRDLDGDVLVVDDDADARARLRHVLEQNGWSVAEAADGREALDQVARARPRVVLLDLTMPVMDGFTFLHELRARPGCDDLPVVVLSARDLTSEDRSRLSEADRVLRKGDVSLARLAGELRALAPGDK